MSDADCTPSREPRSIAASLFSFSSLLPAPRRLCFRYCLSVCLSVSNLHQNFLTDLHEIFTKGWQWATKERHAWCYLQVKLCDPCLSALSVPPWPKKRYKNTLPFLSLLVAAVVVECIYKTSCLQSFSSNVISWVKLTTESWRWFALWLRDLRHLTAVFTVTVQWLESRRPGKVCLCRLIEQDATYGQLKVLVWALLSLLVYHSMSL